MSNIYVLEPPTEGKVLLKTTVGDIEVELWSKEAPKACRNFVQLCMEGYYDGTIFHRVVKEFVVQGGDPMGDGGSHGESIYGKPFKDEFHSRLRFARRGLVAMANSGRDDNTSHFFFTLAACPELNNKNTIFGRVGGDTIYNMLKLADAETDSNDRPFFPQKINKTKVVDNPFDDIVPREKKVEVTGTKDQEKVRSKAVKNFGLLSFGDEAREDEEEVVKATEKYHNKSKSSHDILDDKNLSSIPAVQFEEDKEDTEAKKKVMMDSIRDKLKRKKNEEDIAAAKKSKKRDDSSRVDEFVESELTLSNSSAERIKKYKDEAKKLLKDLRKNTSDPKKDEKGDRERSSKVNRNVEEFEKRRADLVMKNPNRESETFERMMKFKKRLEAANRLTEYDSEEEEEKNDDDAEDDEATNKDISWMTHELKFTEQNTKVLDANIADAERYDISDPRNPITQRRRKEKEPRVKK